MNSKQQQQHNHSYVANSSPQPTHWPLALDCNQRPLMSNQEIEQSMVDSRFNGVNGSDITLVCPLCKVHPPGSCNYTPLHKVVHMTPLYSRQVNEEEAKHEHEQ